MSDPLPRISEVQAKILERLERGDVLTRSALWKFEGDRRQSSWSNCRQLERLGLIEGRGAVDEMRTYTLTDLGRTVLTDRRKA